MDIQDILLAIDQLNPDELQQIRQRLDERQKRFQPQISESTLAWKQRLDSAIAAFREGLSEEELAEITYAMNVEYIDTKAIDTSHMADEHIEDKS